MARSSVIEYDEQLLLKSLLNYGVSVGIIDTYTCLMYFVFAQSTDQVVVVKVIIGPLRLLATVSQKRPCIVGRLLFTEFCNRQIFDIRKIGKSDWL